MTEAEWTLCTDPSLMLETLQGRASQRKLRLFGCACFRHVDFLLADPLIKEGIEYTESIVNRFADCNHQRVQRAVDNAAERSLAARMEFRNHEASRWAMIYQVWSLSLEVWLESMHTLTDELSEAAASRAWETADTNAESRLGTKEREERAYQCQLIREIFARYPPVFPSKCNSLIVKSLATAIYEEVAFDRLPILADALEDAGCTDANILNHCRQPGSHVRGCWVVDLILSKDR